LARLKTHDELARECEERWARQRTERERERERVERLAQVREQIVRDLAGPERRD
jgi:hypothetical protein